MGLLSGQLTAAAGSVSYNGVDLTQCRQAYAALMGYVPQEDIVHGDLTVTEALDYQARLRLGPRSTSAARDARIEHVLTTMGLLEQRNQLVKTLSGGQRKRVSIACELLNEPQILFLDKPTSGLDPGLDKRMMLMLRLLADEGRTVVLTTHAIAQVDVCDTLVLVGPGGHVIYADAPEAALGWFGVPALGDVFSLIESPEAARQAARRVRPADHPVSAAPSAGRLGGLASCHDRPGAHLRQPLRQAGRAGPGRARFQPAAGGGGGAAHRARGAEAVQLGGRGQRARAGLRVRRRLVRHDRRGTGTGQGENDLASGVPGRRRHAGLPGLEGGGARHAGGLPGADAHGGHRLDARPADWRSPGESVHDRLIPIPR